MTRICESPAPRSRAATPHVDNIPRLRNSALDPPIPVDADADADRQTACYLHRCQAATRGITLDRRDPLATGAVLLKICYQYGALRRFCQPAEAGGDANGLRNFSAATPRARIKLIPPEFSRDVIWSATSTAAVRRNSGIFPLVSLPDPASVRLLSVSMEVDRHTPMGDGA